MLTQFIFLDIHIDTESDVLAIRKRALDLIKEGKTVMEWSGEGTSTSKQFTAPVLDILAETRFFLKTLNPTKYGWLTNSSRQIRY